MGRKTAGQGITQWPETERPRERLLAQGADALTDAQLLAILLRVGRHRSSAVQVGMEILDRLGGVAGLARCGIDELCAVPGVGAAKAAQLKAAIGPRQTCTCISAFKRHQDLFQPRSVRALSSHLARPAA